MGNPGKMTCAAIAAAAMIFAAGASAQEAKHYRFAHDQQLNSGYSIAYDIFSARLKELSKGTMLVDQYPGAQLGQEPQILQLVRSGDIDFAIVSSANTSTISPQAGVMSLHFLFRSEEHNIKALADQKVLKTFWSASALMLCSSERNRKCSDITPACGEIVEVFAEETIAKSISPDLTSCRICGSCPSCAPGY